MGLVQILVRTSHDMSIQRGCCLQNDRRTNQMPDRETLPPLAPKGADCPPCEGGDRPRPSARRSPRQWCTCGPLCQFHWRNHRWNWHRVEDEFFEEPVSKDTMHLT